MPGRPPREWFHRCVDDVAAGGAAVDPAAVCGATWARKTPPEKRATVAFEEGTTMATKKKKKAKKSKAKPRAKASGHPKRTAKKKRAKTTAVRRACPYCGHHARHHRTAGCLHREPNGRFCSCKHH
jgi:hypothetical protein